MRVIQLVDKLNSGGGVPSFVYDLCFALREAGCDITLIGILKNETDEKAPYLELEEAGIKVIEINAPSKKKAIALYGLKLRETIKNIAGNDQTILNMHLKLSVLMGCFASVGLKNIKCIETYHNTYLRYHLQFNILRPFIKKYITVSETSRLELINDFYASDNKVIAAPNGVNREKLRAMAGKPEKHEYFSIVSVGRLSYEKNFAIPVEALSSVCSPSIHYTIIGDGPDREKVDAARHGNENIVLTGALPRSEVLKHLASADIVIMSSLWEGRSILQLEAMAFDLPMILSDVPGLREPFSEDALHEDELLRRTSFGYLVRTNDIESYREAVIDYMKDRDTSEMMNKAVRIVSNNNSISKMAKTYLSAFEEVLK
jgi:glycosyltransferase involved in cell wall biosynthesis